MKYYKLIDGDYILLIMMAEYNPTAFEITEEEYNSLLTIIHNRPTDPAGYTYMLRADTLEWELVETPPQPDPEPEEATTEDYQAALGELGVTV